MSRDLPPSVAYGITTPCQTPDGVIIFGMAGDLENGRRGAGKASAAARVLCLSCPVIDECGTYALDHGEPWGIWGGMSPRTRDLLRRQEAS